MNESNKNLGNWIVKSAGYVVLLGAVLYVGEQVFTHWSANESIKKCLVGKETRREKTPCFDILEEYPWLVDAWIKELKE